VIALIRCSHPGTDGLRMGSAERHHVTWVAVIHPGYSHVRNGTVLCSAHLSCRSSVFSRAELTQSISRHTTNPPSTVSQGATTAFVQLSVQQGSLGTKRPVPMQPSGLHSRAHPGRQGSSGARRRAIQRRLTRLTHAASLLERSSLRWATSSALRVKTDGGMGGLDNGTVLCCVDGVASSSCLTTSICFTAL